MAPFKLKFRMGGSRSSSQEADTEQTTQHLLLSNVSSTMSRSNTTINSEQTVDTSSYGSLNNDEYALILTNKTGNPTGYTNPSLAENILEENYKLSTEKSSSAHNLTNVEDYKLDCNSTNDKSMNDTKSLDIGSISCSILTTPSHENLLECTGSCDLLLECQSEDDRNSENIQNFNDNQYNSADEQDNSNESIYENETTETQTNNVHEINEYIDNKSSKEIYKDYAKQWGITCKMSDQCRCIECQSHYFDCEYEENEHQKTDGGLGAGTPMFISEVMHGSACIIL